MSKYVKILLFVLLLYIPSVVYGADLSNFRVVVTSNDRVVQNSGDTANVKVSLFTTNTDISITGCKFKIFVTGDGELLELTGSNRWTAESGQEYSLTNNEGIRATSVDTEASVVIGNISVRVNGNTTVSLKNMICYSADSDISGGHEDVDVSLSVANNDVPTVKIDGSVVSGEIYTITPSTKETFRLSVTSQNADTLSNVTVKALNTLSGEKLVCDSSSLANCDINFANDNFCISGDLCLGVYRDAGDVIYLQIVDSNNGIEPIELFVVRELDQNNQFYTDSTISSLTVYGNTITLIEGQNEYDTIVSGNLSEYSVIATLSDPEHYKWDDENNPSKYNFASNEIILLVVPKDSRTIGATERTYKINVIFTNDGESSSSQPSILPPTSKPSSSREVNPNTGGFATIIVAVIMFSALIVSMRTYNKSME